MPAFFLSLVSLSSLSSLLSLWVPFGLFSDYGWRLAEKPGGLNLKDDGPGRKMALRIGR